MNISSLSNVSVEQNILAHSVLLLFDINETVEVGMLATPCLFCVDFLLHDTISQLCERYTQGRLAIFHFAFTCEKCCFVSYAKCHLRNIKVTRSIDNTECVVHIALVMLKLSNTNLGLVLSCFMKNASSEANDDLIAIPSHSVY